MNKPTIIDTDIIIDAGCGIPLAVECLNLIRINSQLAVSAITQMELLVGCKNKQKLRNLDKFLLPFLLIYPDLQITQTAIKLLKSYRLSHGLLTADSLIAANAIQSNYLLITKNQKHFQFIKGLQLQNYP